MHTPLRFGAPATRTTRVIRIAEKERKSAPLTFVTVRNDIEQGGVYRAPGSRLPAQLRAPGARYPRAPKRSLALVVDPMGLFRFSALMYNAHRIRYDAAHAAWQGYPGLVIRGPMQVLIVGDLIRRSGEPMIGQEFAYRPVAPDVRRVAPGSGAQARGN